MTIAISKKLPEPRIKGAGEREKIPGLLPDHAPSEAFLEALDAVSKMKSGEPH